MLRRSLIVGFSAAALLAGAVAANAGSVYMPPVKDPDGGSSKPTDYVPRWEPNWINTGLSGAAPSNKNVTNRTSAQSETSTAVDPTDPNHILASSNDLGTTAGVFESFDGGASWTRSTFNSSGFCYDTWVDFNSAGDAFIAYECSNQSVAYKLHGSATWVAYNGMTQAGSFPDRCMLTVDNSGGAFDGTVYLGYDDNGASNTAYLLYSRTGKGNTTWVRTPKLNTVGGPTIGVNAAVSPTGVVTAIWSDYTNSKLQITRSTNGGVTWSTPNVVHTFKHNTSGFWWYIPPQNTRGIVAFATTAYAQAGPWAGRLYVTYTDEKPGSTQSAAFARYSDDDGLTWSAATQIGAAIPQITYSYHPQIAVLNDGTVGINFYGTGGAASVAHRMAMAFSHDGGVTWTNPSMVADANSNETISGTDRGNQAGDYQGVDGNNGFGSFSVVWTDTRLASTQGEEMFWANMLPVAAPASKLAKDFGPQTSSVASLAPYTVKASGSTLSFYLPTATNVKLELLDVNGRIVKDLMDGQASEGTYNAQIDGFANDGSRMAHGVYFYRFAADGHVSSGKIIQ